MKLDIEIHKKLREFPLDISIRSDSRRIGILGGSGGGKSMTLKSIAGIMTPDSGRIYIGDRCLYDSEKKINLKPQARRIGYLFQNYALFPTMTVEENICAGLKGSREEKKRRAEEMIEKFHLKGLGDQFPNRLSGGQQQRVALARLMAYEPDAILLDEPFSAMDSYLRDQLQQQMSEMLAGYEGTMILVSHNRDEVYRFCDTLMVINNGQVVRFGGTKDIFANPQRRVAARLTGCKNFTDLERKDAHHAYLADWDVELHTKREIPAGTRYLGYRAHEFIPMWEEEREGKQEGRPENCFPVEVIESVKMPFERNYYLKPKGGKQPHNPEFITWFVQERLWPVLDEKGLPDYLGLDEREMLFLS